MRITGLNDCGEVVPLSLPEVVVVVVVVDLVGPAVYLQLIDLEFPDAVE